MFIISKISDILRYTWRQRSENRGQVSDIELLTPTFSMLYQGDLTLMTSWWNICRMSKMSNMLRHTWRVEGNVQYCHSFKSQTLLRMRAWPWRHMNIWNATWRHSLPRWHKGSFVFKHLCKYCIVLDTQGSDVRKLSQQTHCSIVF